MILVPVGVCAVVIFLDDVETGDRDRRVARLSVLSLGWALVDALEGVAYLWAAHDFFLRFRVVNRHYGTIASIAQWGLNTDPSTIPFSIFPPVTWWSRGDWGHLYQDQAYHALIFCWAFAALVAGLAILASQRRRISDRATAGFAVAAFWLFWPLLYHQFGSQSVSQFVPMHRLSRHLVVYAPGAIFATVAGCFLIKEAIVGLASRERPKHRGGDGARDSPDASLFQLEGRRGRLRCVPPHQGHLRRIREHLPRGVHTIVADPGDLCFFDFWLNPLGCRAGQDGAVRELFRRARI